jgi:hypothetical protein
MGTLRSMVAVAGLAGTLLVATTAAAQKPGAKSPATKADEKKDAPKDPPKADSSAATTPAADAAKAEEPKGDGTPMGAASSVQPPAETWDPKDVEELPGKTYLFVGVRYRGTIVPKFMLNIFVDEGKTIYSNTIGIELDMRKDGFSLIPALQYTEYGTGDIIFKEKNTPDIAGNYSLVNSSLKAFYATADLLWSTQLSKNVAFEYGAGFGLGAIFGDLETTWVRFDPNGNLEAGGHKFSRCDFEGQDGPNSGCNKANHKNSSVAKVGQYFEPSWFNGGSKPNVFPHISFPQIGLRFKPLKQVVGRLGLGFSLTGFWFGLSGQYGLEQKPKP